jgi:hypothetical protein
VAIFLGLLCSRFSSSASEIVCLSAPVEIVLVADSVASEIVCCMQLGNRVVEKVVQGILLHKEFIRPITMVWPPISQFLTKQVKNNDP